jgi:hypothetical protein
MNCEGLNTREMKETHATLWRGNLMEMAVIWKNNNKVDT